MNLCIVGTGYVGLVSAACFAEMGNDVCCVDSNPTIVENLRIGKVHIYEPGLDELVKRNVAEGRLRFTTQVSEGMENALFVFITVGTPPREDGSCDLSYVYEVAREIGANMKDFKVIVDKSTVPVGISNAPAASYSLEKLVRKNYPALGPNGLDQGKAPGAVRQPRQVVGRNDQQVVPVVQLTGTSPGAHNRLAVPASGATTVADPPSALLKPLPARMRVSSHNRNFRSGCPGPRTGTAGGTGPLHPEARKPCPYRNREQLQQVAPVLDPKLKPSRPGTASRGTCKEPFVLGRHPGSRAHLLDHPATPTGSAKASAWSGVQPRLGSVYNR